MKLPIYLDNSATTPVDPRVVAKMLPWLADQFGNPASSSHAFGHAARAAVEAARDQVAALINADPGEIVWTSGATESDNLAIKGAALACRDKGKHLITMQTEHKAVLDTMLELERAGFTVTSLAPEPNGLLDLEKFKAALRPDTTLASIMLVNNEIGVIQDVAALGEICRERGVLFHVDAAQATGKVAIDLQKLKIDLMSLTAHKTYGPKGIGALYVSRDRRVRLEPQMHGGGHERGMRSGTLATHQIVGMGKAYELADPEREAPRLAALRDRLWKELAVVEGARSNGDPERRAAHVLNVAFPGVDGESLRFALNDVCVSAGSACAADSPEASHVLTGMGLSDVLAGSSLRFSVGRFTTEDDVVVAAARVAQAVARLRSLARAAPAWCSA